MIHYHPLNETESSTGDETTFFYIGYRPASESSSSGSTLPTNQIIAFLPNEQYEKVILDLGEEEATNINHLNNVLIINTATNVHFLYWNYDKFEYIELNQPVLPSMSIRSDLGDDEPFHATQKNVQTSGIEYEEEFAADFPDYYSKCVDFIKNKKDENMVTESYVMVMVAYRLFDGSFIMHSQPLMVYCGTQWASYRYIYAGDVDKVERGYFDISAAKPILKLYTDRLKDLAEPWKDIISGLTVFMTRPQPFFTFPQSKTGYTWKAQINHVGEGKKLADIGIDYMPQSKAVKDMVDDPVYYRVNEISWNALTKSPFISKSLDLGFNPDNVKQDFNYYAPIDSFTHHRLLSQVQYVYNRRLHQGGVTTIFGDADTQLMVDPAFDETLQGDGYTKLSFMSAFPGDWDFWAEVSIRTSSGDRVVLTKFDKMLSKAYYKGSMGYDPGGTGQDSSRSGSWSLSSSGSTIRGTGPLDPNGDPVFTIPFMPILSYADPRAYKLRILITQGNGQLWYELKSFDLKAHPFLAMAYYANYVKILNAWTSDSGSGNWEDPEYYGFQHFLFTISANTTLHQIQKPTENRLYFDENRLQVSRIDNPFVNEAKHSYQIGGQDSSILGLATSSVQVSDGQFGEFPLFIFTNEGIYTLRQGTDPAILYSSISPVSKERLIPGTLCEVADGIIYATVDGVKLLSGTQVKNISENILLNANNPLVGNADYESLIGGTGRAVVDLRGYLDAADFRRYMNGAKIAYDSYQNEVILCNPSYQYTYIYNIRADVWFKSLDMWSDFITIPPKYYGVKADRLDDMEQENENEDKSILIQTKPIKLGSQGFKSLSRIVIRQHLTQGYSEQSTSGSSSGSASATPIDEIEGAYLFGSGDGSEWKLIRGVNIDTVAGKHGIHRIVMPMANVSLRYIILLLVAKVTTFDFSHIEVSFFNKMQNKLR